MSVAMFVARSTPYDPTTWITGTPDYADDFESLAAPASQSYAGSAGATTLALVIVTWRKLTAASEDPDPYPLTGTARCAAVTGAVRGML